MVFYTVILRCKKILKLTPEAIQKNYVIAECCKPIPGADVLGYIGDNNRIIIQTIFFFNITNRFFNFFNKLNLIIFIYITFLAVDAMKMLESVFG